MSKKQNNKNKKHQFEIIDNVTIKRINNINGKVIEQETYHNLIVDSGLARVADLIAQISINGFNYIAIGEGVTLPADGDTTLQTEQKRELAIITKPSSNQIEYENVFTFGSGESFNITEAGLFDSVSSGTMLNRLTFTAKAVDSNTDLSVTVTINIDRP